MKKKDKDQFTLFQDDFWIAEIDNNTRMWRCPGCSGRMIGQPLHWHQFNSYNYCPYCGLKLLTRLQDLIVGDDNDV